MSPDTSLKTRSRGILAANQPTRPGIAGCTHDDLSERRHSATPHYTGDAERVPGHRGGGIRGGRDV